MNYNRYVASALILLVMTACNFNGSKTCNNTCPEGQVQKEDCTCYTPEKQPATEEQQKEILQSILNNNEKALNTLITKIAPDSRINLSVLPDVNAFKQLYINDIDVYSRLNYQTNNLTLLSLLAPLNNFNNAFNTLLKQGADPNLQAFAGFPPLKIAISSNRGEKVAELLSSGAELNLEEGNNIIMNALSSGKYNALASLSNYVKAKNIPFTLPANYFAEALMDNQTEIAIAVAPLTPPDVLNTPNNFGVLPLVQAAFTNNLKLMDALIASGADLELRDQNYRTPLLAYLQEVYIAQIEGNYPLGKEAQITETVKHFLDKGADRTAKDFSGEDIMFYAVTSNDMPLIDLLVNTYKHDMNTRNNQGETPLFTAAQNHPEMVPVLLQKGASAKVTDKNGRTPAIAAVEMGNMDTYDFLESAANSSF